MAVSAGVQAITTVWTKQSRSGDAAHARATVPDAFAFKFRAGAGIPIHSVLLKEEMGFETAAEEIEHLPPPFVWHGPRIVSRGPRIGLDLRLDEKDGRLAALLRQNRSLRPLRPHLAKYAPVASLMLWERVRIVINFRYSGSSLEWIFSQTVINIAFGLQPVSKLFDADPDRISDLRLQLGW